MTKSLNHSWLLEDDVQLKALLTALEKKYTLVETPESNRRVTYLDTFDWRIWRKGGVLECHEFAKQQKLLWRAIDHLKIHAEIPVDECPVFVNDVPDWLRPNALMEITRPRALVEQALSRIQMQTYEIRGSGDKVVSRLSIIRENFRHHNNRSGEALLTRVQVDHIRGYKKAFGKVGRIISQVGLNVYGKDPFVQLLKIQDRHPYDYSNHLRLHLQPRQRADAAARQIMLQLFQMREVNEHGIVEDIDTEYLHDYRRAVQRAHSLLQQLKHVIPEDTRQRFDEDLVWINDKTSRLFELNCWLLNFEEHRQQLDSDQQQYMEELLDWLRRQRHAALLKVVKLINSDDYKKFMKRWRVYLECEVPEHSVLKRAEKPVLDVASRQIWKVYQKLTFHEDANVFRLLQVDLLDMGKQCNTLYDLLALSRTLYPDGAIAELSASLHTFQVALESCIQRQSQVQALRGFARDMKKEGLQDKKTGLAIEMLLDRILDIQSECLKAFQSAYIKITHDDIQNSYQRLFKPGFSS